MENNKEFTPTKIDFSDGKTVIDHVAENGKKFKGLLLSGDRIAVIKEGTGADVEDAGVISAGNQKKYMSAMMAKCTSIDGMGMVMEDLADLPMKDYMAIQVAFSDLNF